MASLEDSLRRAEFPLTERATYLDVAWHNITPVSVTGAMDTFCREELQGGGIPKWDPFVGKVREKAARLLSADAGEVAFVKNTSDGINVAANAIPFREGDNVIINDLEHPSNVLPWRNLERRGVEVRVVRNVSGRLPVSDVVAAADSRTRVIAVSSVQFSNGLRVDVPGLAQFCRPRGIILVVDAIQSLGTLDCDVDAEGIDILAAGAHKGLLGPYGIGCLFVRKELISDLHPAYLSPESIDVEGIAGVDTDPRLHEDARRFEVGNHNVLGVAGLSAALDLLSEIGVARISEHVMQLNQQLVEGLDARGLSIISPLGQGERSSIVTFKIPGAERAIDHFLSNAVHVSLRRGNVRASMHIYNRTEDIERFLQVLDAHLDSC